MAVMEADPLVQKNIALHTLLMYYNDKWLNGDFTSAMWNIHANVRTKTQWRDGIMAQPAQQRHRPLPPKHLQTCRGPQD